MPESKLSSFQSFSIANEQQSEMSNQKSRARRRRPLEPAAQAAQAKSLFLTSLVVSILSLNFAHLDYHSNQAASSRNLILFAEALPSANSSQLQKPAEATFQLMNLVKHQQQQQTNSNSNSSQSISKASLANASSRFLPPLLGKVSPAVGEMSDSSFRTSRSAV